MSLDFRGFSRECLEFYRGLRQNNTTTWFNQHRADYDEYVLAPARSFVMEMGDRLHPIAPGVNADPRVNRSLFRINRDTRFSKDKTPFKTHLGMWFWEGAGPRMECSGFYIHLEPDRLILGTGIYRFTPEMLGKYRDWVVDRKHGAALREAVEESAAAGPYALGGEHYKRVPRGYDPNHPNAKFLLHDGFWMGLDLPVPEVLFTPEFPEWCFGHCLNVLPVHKWILELIG